MSAPPDDTPLPTPPAERLRQHLVSWVGAWPPRVPFAVVPAVSRAEAGWDGQHRPVGGVRSPEGTVLGVVPHLADAVRALPHDLDDPAFGAGLAAALGWEEARLFVGRFRWSGAPADLADAGEWVAHDDPRVPPWLRPFGGDVLVAWDDDGAYGAGVGIKRHDAWGRELSVVTEPALRGRGLARRLVAQAARRVLAEGHVPTYLHDPANEASARVADAAGFSDEGWDVIGLMMPDPAPDA